MASRRPATATTTDIASNTAPPVLPPKATSTATSAQTAATADQIRRTTPATPGSRLPASTTARNRAATAAMIDAAISGPTTAETNSTGNAPPAVAKPSNERLDVVGNRSTAPPTASTAAAAQAPASPGFRSVPNAAEANATSMGKVQAAVRATNIATQSLPNCTGSDAADSASMNPISSSETPSATTGASTARGTSTNSASCWESQRRARVRPPPPITAASTKPTGAESHS
ncbi:Uncharacterised protein [Mycobacteroides abscessus subsp. abscessus]|nr:Uncharacterised protein [Mycobacteroides abscessus subsp. abscessus]